MNNKMIREFPTKLYAQWKNNDGVSLYMTVGNERRIKHSGEQEKGKRMYTNTNTHKHTVDPEKL